MSELLIDWPNIFKFILEKEVKIRLKPAMLLDFKRRNTLLFSLM